MKALKSSGHAKWGRSYSQKRNTSTSSAVAEPFVDTASTFGSGIAAGRTWFTAQMESRPLTNAAQNQKLTSQRSTTVANDNATTHLEQS